MSSTWQGEPEPGRVKAVGRLRKRPPARGASLALPAAVMIVLGAAFVLWFLIGSPPGGGQVGQANATTTIRPPVQPPRIASAPALVEAMVSEPATPPVLPALILSGEPEAAAPESAAGAMLPLALQPTRQISTPAPMTAVVGEPQQISAPRSAPPLPPAPPERRAPIAPVTQPMAQVAQAPMAPPKAAPVSAPAPVPASSPVPATVAAETEKENPSRGVFAIILASVETEAEARAKVGLFKQKFASLLGARRLNYHRTKQDGALVWHVRSTGMTEADAEELCDQIEKAGGECAAWPQ